jgi:beta-lactamase class D
MKKEGIKIRIDSSLKDEFKKVCDQESVTMSDKIHDFIFSEVESKKIKSLESNFEEMVKQMGYGNIYIVDSSNFVWNNEEKRISSHEEGGTFIQLPTYSMNILEFLKENSNKTILMYLKKCDFSNNWIRAYVF